MLYLLIPAAISYQLQCCSVILLFVLPGEGARELQHLKAVDPTKTQVNVEYITWQCSI